jgi:hypothetical protein
LASERSWIGGGMGPMMPTPTPFRAVLAWAEWRELSGENTEILLEGLRVIDGEYISATAAKAKAQ